MGFDLEGAALEEASGAGGEAAGETYGVVAILHQPVWRDVAFGAVEEAYDGIVKAIRRPISGNRGQTGLPANFRQTAPEIHGSLVSPRSHQCTNVFERGAGDAGEVAGVEVGIVGDGGRVHGEEEQPGARHTVAEDLNDLQGGVGGEVARAAEGCAVGTSSAEAAAAFEDRGAQGFGVPEEGRDGATALDAGSAAPIETQFVGAGRLGMGFGNGVGDGISDAGGQEIEERGVEVGEGSGEGIIDFGGGEVGGAVVGVGGGEDEILGAEAPAAIDGFQHLGVQAGGNGEQLGGDERELVAAAVVEIEGPGVEPGPVTAGDASAGAVAAQGDAGRRSDVGFSGAGGEPAESGRCRVQRISWDGDPVSGAAGEQHRGQAQRQVG